MPTFSAQCRLTLLAVCLLATGVRMLHAAPPVDVISVDLAPLIDSAAASPTRFAVDVPHRVSTNTSGEWTKSGAVSTWTYSAQIPGAVSMSFHATDALLPASATLVVTADGVDYVYTSKDAPGGDFWSRIGRGDSLTFRLDVASEDVARVRLEIASFQAGYRSFGAGARSNPNYDGLRKQALAIAPCAENWSCDVNATNAGPGNATAALIINNTAQCTGVLLNDVPGDGTPYLLTARHCQNGSADGGAPGVAGSIVVYWNAVTACGSVLGSIYDAGIARQYGAETVVEQQDTWLVRLRDLPAVDAYYAGWDATGGTFVGGFTPDHADGRSRQFVGWYGQAAYLTMPPASLGVEYTSTFWGTVNVLGAGGPGSSGAGLFDDTGHLVGTLVRGLSAADGSGQCPAASPPVPSESTATALSTALSGVFSSTADPGSTTGAATLQTVLDPGKTGMLVLEGQRRPITVTLTSYGQSLSTGTRTTLSWSVWPASTTCTAAGGEPGDGWPGAVPTTGSRDVTSFDGGDITYTVTCTDGQRTGAASVTLHWTLGAPAVSLSGSYYADYGVPAVLSWFSNVRPCTASGGSTGDGWGGPVNPTGTASVVETVVGPVSYTVTCGSGDRVASQQFLAQVTAPSASVQADAATLRLGETVNINAQLRGAPCVKTGGGTGDGWAGTLPANNQYTQMALTETTPGSYTYSVACGSGSNVATAQVTVTFRDDPPAVSLRLSSTTAIIDVSAIDVTWDSNVRPCQMSIAGPTGPGTAATVVPFGTTTIREEVIGQYTVGIACGSGANTAQASATMNWTGTPTMRLDAPTDAVRGSGFYIVYYTNVVPCTASGGTAGDSWSGQFNAQTHAINVVEQTAGRQTYTLTCGSGSQTASRTVSVNVAAEAPLVTLTPDRAQQITGQPVTLSWSSNTSACQAYGGSGSDGWSGALSASGAITLTERTATNYFYGITCGTGSLTTNSYAYVTFADVAAPTLTVSTSEAIVGDTVTLTWSSADGSTCFGTGGTGLDNWYGPRPASGTLDARMVNQGGVSFSLVCGASLTATVGVMVNPPPPPAVTLTASASSVTVGDSLTLTWTVSRADSCMASGGTSGDGWSGSLSTQGGSTTVHPTFGGQLLYTITCYVAGNSGMASAPVTVSQPASPPATGGGGGSGGGGGGGGGGSIGPVDLAFFAMLGLLSCWQRRRNRASVATPVH